MNKPKAQVPYPQHQPGSKQIQHCFRSNARTGLAQCKNSLSHRLPWGHKPNSKWEPAFAPDNRWRLHVRGKSAHAQKRPLSATTILSRRRTIVKIYRRGSWFKLRGGQTSPSPIQGSSVIENESRIPHVALVREIETIKERRTYRIWRKLRVRVSRIAVSGEILNQIWKWILSFSKSVFDFFFFLSSVSRFCRCFLYNLLSLQCLNFLSFFCL